MQTAVFAEFVVRGEAEGGGREGDVAERRPEVLSQSWGNGLFAYEGELFE